MAQLVEHGYINLALVNLYLLTPNRKIHKDYTSFYLQLRLYGAHVALALLGGLLDCLQLLLVHIHLPSQPLHFPLQGCPLLLSLPCLALHRHLGLEDCLLLLDDGILLVRDGILFFEDGLSFEDCGFSLFLDGLKFL